jgi:hypothetical protein
MAGLERPLVYDLTRDGRRSTLVEWQRRDDGWWARVTWTEIDPNAGWREDAYIECEEWRPADRVRPVEGEDYSQVPRTHRR